jgi:uncharacterized membrane protein
MEEYLSWSERFYRFLFEYLGYTHPVHPTQINMPIGLVTGGLVLAILALLSRRTALRASARHCMVLALLFMVPTVLTGVMDWQHYLGGVWIPPIKAKIALGVILLLLLVWGILIGRRDERSGGLVLVSLLAFAASAGLGYFGGEIVFGGRAPQSTQGNQAGEIVFRNSCSMCHPYGANILMPERPLIRSPLLGSFQTFLPWLRNPSPPMPPFPPGDIPDEQAQELYRYLAEMWSGHAHEGEGREEPLTPAEPFSDPAVDGVLLNPRSQVHI